MAADKTGFSDNVEVSVQHANGSFDRYKDFNDFLKIGGRVHVEHVDKDGNVKGKYDITNGITNVGKNYALDAIFRGATDGPQKSPWYIGLIDNSGFTGVAATDTMASHAGWNEFTTYSDTTRREWVENAAASQSISNTTASTFNINGSGTVKGIFIADNSTKGGTTGTLWSTALFAANVAVVSSDQLKITYTVNAG